MKHFTSPSFWKCYNALPEKIQNLADKNYTLLKNNSKHPSLHFKKVGRYRAVRVGLNHRAVGVEIPDGILWFWIGNHDDYTQLISS